MIVVNTVAGLCNRMCAIYSAVCMAQDKKDDLYILWHNSVLLPCDFEELFSEIKSEVKITVLNIKAPKYLLRKNLKSGKLLEVTRELKNRYEFKKYNLPKVIYGKYLRGADCIIKPDEPLPGNFNLKRNKHIFVNTYGEVYGNESYNMMRFLPELYEMASNILYYPKENIIGVHIRRTDYTKIISESPSELFFQKIREEIIKNPDIRFFVATDDKNELISLKKEFGEKYFISQDGKTYERYSLKGQKEAVIDLLCLARCSKIFGSNSSFCYVASKIGNIELVKLIK